MPKSKRATLVTLSKTSKKGREVKNILIEKLRDSVDDYKYIYIFSVENMRNRLLKEMREHWSDSRFFMGKNRVMAVGLGRTPSEEYKPQLSLLAEHIRGGCGLMFTNSSLEEVREFFDKFQVPEFARSGFVVDQEFVIPAGPLTGFQFSMEPTFRQLGLNTSLENGVITLANDHTVCKPGDVLTPEQGRLLKLFDQMFAVFKISIKCMWTDGKFTDLGMADMADGA